MLVGAAQAAYHPHPVDICVKSRDVALCGSFITASTDSSFVILKPYLKLEYSPLHLVIFFTTNTNKCLAIYRSTGSKAFHANFPIHRNIDLLPLSKKGVPKKAVANFAIYTIPLEHSDL